MTTAKLTIATIGLGAVVLGLTFGIPAMRHAAEKMEHETLVANPLAAVRDGATRVLILDTELLHALAADPKCAATLTEITFSSVTLDASDQDALKRLRNVTAVGFYCCKNVDSLVPTLCELPIGFLSFELVDISPESLITMRDVMSIREIAFEQNLSESQVNALRSFPASIKITTSFPLDAYD